MGGEVCVGGCGCGCFGCMYTGDVNFHFYCLVAGKHSIFGRVSDGIETVKRIGMVNTDSHDR